MLNTLGTTVLAGAQKVIDPRSAPGVEKGGKFSAALTQKVTDSGSGSSILIYGGEWGVRFNPVSYEDEPWDLGNPHQWGEPYKFYATEQDLIY